VTHAANVKEAARGTGLILSGAFVAQLLEYGYRFALARGLGPEGFGTFSQGRAVLMAAAALASLGLGIGVKRFVAHERNAGRNAEARRAYEDGSKTIVVAAVLGGLAMFLLARPLASVLHNAALVDPLRVLAIGLPFLVGLDYITRVAEAFRSFRPSVVARQWVDPTLRLVSGLALLAAGASLTVLFGAFAASTAVAFAVAVVLVGRIDALREASPAPTSQLGPLLRFSLPVAFGGVLYGFAERVDILMIGLYRPEADVGFYAAASALARVQIVLAAAMIPVFSTLGAEAAGRDDRDEITRLMRLACRWMLILALPVAVATMLFARGALSLLFGPEYEVAAPTLRWLVAAYLIPTLAGPVGLFLDSLGKTHWSLANMIVRTGLNVLLNLVFIPRWGIVGAAFATTAALWISVVLYRTQLAGLVSLAGTYAGWTRPLLVLAAASGVGWGVGLLVPGVAVSAVAGGGALLAVYAIGMKLVPGCLREGDLEIFAFVRSKFGG
jgi:O-antigen/teichoic acid export membrane protein